MLEERDEAAELTRDILQRLERGEQLAPVALAARRLAELVGDRVRASWLGLELAGLDAPKPARGAEAPDHRAATDMFLSLRAVIDQKQIDPDRYHDPETRRQRNSAVTTPLSVLEAIREPLVPQSPVTHDAYEEWRRAFIGYSETRRVLLLIREDLHRWVSSQHAFIRSAQLRSELFGRDAATVFMVGGNVLDDLEAAADDLRRPGRHATAATEARTAILRMGRELYEGGKTHTSPISGQTFEVRQEVNMLHAYVDSLWARADNQHKQSLENAHRAIDDAYEIGSKAKNPVAITYDEAEQGVKACYEVAHAIAFSGGFPPKR